MKLMRIFLTILFLIVDALHAQAIVNGDFDLGRNNGWIEYSKGSFTLIGTGALFASTDITPPVTPHSGQYMGRIGGFSYEINSLSQTVTLPNTTPLYLKLYVQDRNATTSECAGLWVGAQIRVFVAGQKLYDTYLCQYSQHETWTPVYFDLTAVAGQSVQIIFQADAANSVWSFLYIDEVSLTNQITGIEKEKGLLPIKFELKQNYPNPFNPSTKIEFSLPKKEQVSLKIFNSIGDEVATLVNEALPAGIHNRTWNAADIASGVYFFRLQAGGFIETKKLVLMK
jgi:hypothetical protein